VYVLISAKLSSAALAADRFGSNQSAAPIIGVSSRAFLLSAADWASGPNKTRSLQDRPTT